MTGIREQLIPSVTDILRSVAGATGLAPCTVYLVRHKTTHKPGEPSSDTFEPVLKTSAIDLRQRVTRGDRNRSGIEAAEVHTCQIAMPTHRDILSWPDA